MSNILLMRCLFFSDRYGRMWTMTISLGLMGAIGVGVAAAPSFLAVAILRIVLMLPSSVSYNIRHIYQPCSRELLVIHFVVPICQSIHLLHLNRLGYNLDT